MSGCPASRSEQGPALSLRSWQVSAALTLLSLALAGALAGTSAGDPLGLSAVVVVGLGAVLVAVAVSALVAIPGLLVGSCLRPTRRGDRRGVGVEAPRAQAPGRPGRPMPRAPGGGPLPVVA